LIGVLGGAEFIQTLLVTVGKQWKVLAENSEKNSEKPHAANSAENR
jgi:hypothetical protein